MFKTGSTERLRTGVVLARARTLTAALMIGCTGSGLALPLSQPIILTDAQLDSVNAGYVIIGIDAQAVARRGNPIAVAITLTSVEEGLPQEDGYIYTVAEGHGYAYASGEIVITSVNVDLDTDEEFVSSNVHGIRNQSGRDYQMLLPGVASSGSSHAKERLEFVTVRVVTRKPAPASSKP